MRKKVILPKEGYILVNEGSINELNEICANGAFQKEVEALHLVDALIKDVVRLQRMVIKTREKANRLSPDREVSFSPAEDVFNCTYHDLPAIKRYYEIYGVMAIRIWEEWGGIFWKRPPLGEGSGFWHQSAISFTMLNPDC